MIGKNIKFYSNNNFYEGKVEKEEIGWFKTRYLVRYTYRCNWQGKYWEEPNSARWITSDQII